MANKFKELLILPGVYISLNCDVKIKGRDDIKLIHVGNVEYINFIYKDIEYKWAVSWCALVAHYEVNLPMKLMQHIRFEDVSNAAHSGVCGSEMFFTRPLGGVVKGTRIVPGYVNYSVTRTGELYDNFTGSMIFKPRSKKDGTDDYLRCKIYDPDMSKFTNKIVHRLVALAWVKNPNRLELRIVNHKDGNKRNPNHDNLEWCSYAHNAGHAFKEGLRSDNKPVIVRDRKKDVYTEYHSLAEAARSIKVCVKAFSRWVKFNYGTAVYRKRWEVIYVDDKLTKWITEPVQSSKKSYTNIQCFNITEDKIYKCNTVAEATELTNLSRSTIVNKLKGPENQSYRGWAIREYSNKPWNTKWLMNPQETKVIKCICPEGKTYTAPSLRQMSQIINIDKKFISGALKGTGNYKGYLITQSAIEEIQ